MVHSLLMRGTNPKPCNKYLTFPSSPLAMFVPSPPHTTPHLITAQHSTSHQTKPHHTSPNQTTHRITKPHQTTPRHRPLFALPYSPALQPENVLLSSAGDVKLSDFGCSKVFATGRALMGGGGGGLRGTHRGRCVCVWGGGWGGLIGALGEGGKEGHIVYCCCQCLWGCGGWVPHVRCGRGEPGWLSGVRCWASLASP